ncbi:phage tail protein, partial [Vibrio gazogenes]
MIDKVTQPLTGVIDQINQIVQTASSDFDKVKSSASDVVQTFTEMGTSLEPILTMDWEVGGADSLENVGRILEHVSTASSEILSLGLGSQLVQVFKDAEGGINKFANSLDQGIDNVVETFDLAKTKAKDFSNTAKAQFAALSQRTQNYIQIGKRLTTSFSANGVKGFASAVKQQFAGISQQTQSLIGRIKNVGAVFSTGGFKNGAKNFAKSVNQQLTSISQKAAGLSGMGGRAQQFLGPISSSLDNVKNSLSQGMGEGIAKVTALGEKFPFLSGGTELVAAGMTSLDGVMKSASGTISGVQSAITLVSDSAGIFQSVMGSASTVITTFQGVMGAMSNVMAVFGRLIPSVSTAMMVMTSPVTWIVLGIVALIAAVYLIIKYWDDLVAAFSNVWIFQQIGDLFGWLGKQWGKFTSYLSGSGVTSILMNIYSGFATVFNGIGSVVSGIAGVIGSTFSLIFAPIRVVFKLLQAFWTLLIDGPAAAMDVLMGIPKIFTGIADSFSAAFSSITQGIKTYIDGMLGIVKTIGSGISWIAGKLGLSFGSDDAKKPEQGGATETRAAEKLQKQVQPVAQVSKSEKHVLTEARTTENIRKQVQPVTRASKSEKRVLTEARTTENIRKQVQPVTRVSKSEKRVLTEARTTENIRKQVQPATQASKSEKRTLTEARTTENIRKQVQP